MNHHCISISTMQQLHSWHNESFILRSKSISSPYHNRKPINLEETRLAFCKDLTKFIHQLQAQGDSILLSGNFNEIMDDGTGMQMLARETGLIDIFELIHGTKTEPTTYLRGKQQIDYILLSNNLIPSIKYCRYRAYHMMFQSDHCGMW